MPNRILVPTHFRDIQPDYNVNWLVQETLGVGDMSCVYGPPGATKSFFALDMALHISLGWVWMGKVVTKGAVVYVSCEGGRRFVHRVEAFRREYEDRLKMVSPPPFGLIAAPVDLLSNTDDLECLSAGCESFVQECKEPLRLLVIDTVARAMAGGDENGPKDMGEFIKNVDLLRELTKAHVMLIHHTGKDTDRGGRGHNSLKGAVETEILVTSNTNTRTSTAKIIKQKDGEDGGCLSYKLKTHHLGTDTQGLSIKSCTVDYLPPPGELTTSVILEDNPIPALLRQKTGMIGKEELFLLWSGEAGGNQRTQAMFAELCAKAIQDGHIKMENDYYGIV